MKKVTLAFLLLGAMAAKAQEVKNDTIKTVTIESLKETVDEHSMKFSGFEERFSTAESLLDKLSKIKISGYIQAQYEMYDTWTAAGIHGVQTSSASTTQGASATNVTSSFFLRRARIKFTYEALDGIKFVMQPEFAFDKVSVKDAYVVLNDRWAKTFSLTLGQFDRPNYEVEYSSGALENIERTKMSKTLYPGERDLGVKLEANFDTKYGIPLKLKLAVLNGNFNLGTTTNQVKDVDSNKDILARAIYSFKFPNAGLGIDIGGHGYFGKTEILPGTTLTGFKDANNTPLTVAVGNKLDKKWFGAEMQVYYDFLGGMALKGEYIAGTNSGVSEKLLANYNSEFPLNGERKFAGFYTQLIKNVGVKNQFVARYDSWDPNTKLAGNNVATKDELKYTTLSMSWIYFFDENIKINMGYTMPTNEKSTNVGVGTDYLNRDKKDNIFTLRIQATF